MLEEKDWDWLQELVAGEWFIGDWEAKLKLHFSTKFLIHVKLLEGTPFVRAANLLMALQEQSIFCENPLILDLFSGLRSSGQISNDEDLLEG